MNAYATFRKWGAAVLMAGLVLACPARALATPELEKEVGKFAQRIKAFLDERNEKAVTLGPITGPPQLAANPGPGLKNLLSLALKKQNVDLRPAANLGIKGEFRPVRDAKSKALAMEVKLRIVDSSDRSLAIFSCGILGDSEVAILAGMNTNPGPVADTKKRKKKMEDELIKPQVAVEGTKVTNGPGTPYGVEILVGEQAKQPEIVDKLAFVKIERGEIYAIKLYNNTDREMAALVHVDGLNVFAFNEDPDPDGQVRREFHVIIPKRGSQVIQGWYRSGGKSDSFMVTSYPNSAVGQLGLQDSDAVGTITAVFKACWPKGETPPADEGRTRSADATGFGPPVEERYVRVERAFGIMRSAITVRYNKQ
jgi:hypothetical protein